MKTLVKVLLALSIATIASTAAFSQTTRITFKRGATSALVTGYLRGYKDHKSFVIRVRKGQTLSTESVDSHYITVLIGGPPGSGYEQDFAADCHSTNEVTPTAKGDYTFQVTECLKADPFRGRFRLKVTVE